VLSRFSRDNDQRFSYNDDQRDGFVLVSFARWQRVVIAALLVVPLIVLLVLSAPGLLAWPFTSEARRTSVLQFVDKVVDWVKAIAGLS
jgi:hypothetical protein